jgi:hypothetical protein
VFAQVDEVGAQIVLGERGRIALDMIGQPADIPDVLLLGLGPVIFELDMFLEFDDGWVVGSFDHNRASLPVSADKISPAPDRGNDAPENLLIHPPRSGSVQQDHCSQCRDRVC